MARKAERPQRGVPASQRKGSRALMGIVAIAFFIIVFMGGLAWMRSGSDSPVKSASLERPADKDTKPRPAVQASYEVVNSYPHDPTAFLQGLVWVGGHDFVRSLDGRAGLGV